MALGIYGPAGEPAWAGDTPSSADLGESEDALVEEARQGRLTQDELIKKGEDLSYFTRLKLYLYAKELEPYFEGVEDTFRDLARSDPADRESMDRGRRKIYDEMLRARERLKESGREEIDIDWRRGLVGLIWLDHEWRGRVYEQGKDEIKNPYDLVALVDCLDARLRGLEKGGIEQCVIIPKQEPGKDATSNEQLSE